MEYKDVTSSLVYDLTPDQLEALDKRIDQEKAIKELNNRVAELERREAERAEREEEEAQMWQDTVGND